MIFEACAKKRICERQADRKSKVTALFCGTGKQDEIGKIKSEIGILCLTSFFGDDIIRSQYIKGCDEDGTDLASLRESGVGEIPTDKNRISHHFRAGFLKAEASRKPREGYVNA